MEWTWSDPRWRVHVGSDVDATMREALRRAVDLRDLEEIEHYRSRALFLVHVLNHLSDLLAVDTTSLWERT